MEVALQNRVAVLTLVDPSGPKGRLRPICSPHCIAGSFGARLHDGLQHELLPDAVVVTKSSSMSAFGSPAKGETTQLRGLLQRRAPSHAVVCGLALEYAPLQHWHTHSHNRMHGEVCDALSTLQVLRDGDRSRLRGHAAGGLRRAGQLQVLRVRRPGTAALPVACFAVNAGTSKRAGLVVTRDWRLQLPPSSATMTWTRF